MKSIVIWLVLVLAVGAQTPTRLFDVRNGGATTIMIEFKDAAAKTALINAFAEQRGYQAEIDSPQEGVAKIPNPQTKAQFFNKQMEAFLRETYKANSVEKARATAGKAAADKADSELP